VKGWFLLWIIIYNVITLLLFYFNVIYITIRLVELTFSSFLSLRIKAKLAPKKKKILFAYASLHIFVDYNIARSYSTEKVGQNVIITVLNCVSLKNSDNFVTCCLSQPVRICIYYVSFTIILSDFFLHIIIISSIIFSMQKQNWLYKNKGDTNDRGEYLKINMVMKWHF